MGTWSPRRFVVAGLSLAVIPVATNGPALVALALLAAVWAGLIAYEALRVADARHRLHASEAH